MLWPDQPDRNSSLSSLMKRFRNGKSFEFLNGNAVLFLEILFLRFMTRGVDFRQRKFYEPKRRFNFVFVSFIHLFAIFVTWTNLSLRWNQNELFSNLKIGIEIFHLNFFELIYWVYLSLLLIFGLKRPISFARNLHPYVLPLFYWEKCVLNEVKIFALSCPFSFPITTPI